MFNDLREKVISAKLAKKKTLEILKLLSNRDVTHTIILFAYKCVATIVLSTLVLAAVYSSPLHDLQCCPQDPATLECGGSGCNDFCCGCAGECSQANNLQCDWIKCAVAVAQCIEDCCEGSCLGSDKCISCLGNSYEICKDCWSMSEGDRFRNLIIKGATHMRD